jgi:hypothetical protein
MQVSQSTSLQGGGGRVQHPLQSYPTQTSQFISSQGLGVGVEGEGGVGGGMQQDPQASPTQDSQSTPLHGQQSEQSSPSQIPQSTFLQSMMQQSRQAAPIHTPQSISLHVRVGVVGVGGDGVGRVGVGGVGGGGVGVGVDELDGLEDELVGVGGI